MDDFVVSTTEAVRSTLPHWLEWVAVLFGRSVEYVLGPVRDAGGRFHWIGLVAALVLAGWVFAFAAVPRAAGEGDGGEAQPRGRVRRFLAFCFPASVWINRSTWVDLQVGFINSVVVANALNITWRINGALFAAWVTAGLTAVFGPSPIGAAWGVWPLIGFTIAMSMADDFGYFLFHWASHRFGPLWEIHKLHHSAEVMSPLTAARVHPLERVVLGPIRAVTTGVVIGPALYLYGGEASVMTVLGLNAMAVLFNALGHVLHHSHVWLYFGPVVGRVIISPAQHQIHHSSLPRHLDRNFGEHWALWDWMFGTLYLPKGREEMKFGLAGYDRQPHDGAVRAFAGPVVGAVAAGYRMVRGWLPGRRSAQEGEPARR